MEGPERSMRDIMITPRKTTELTLLFSNSSIIDLLVVINLKSNIPKMKYTQYNRKEMTIIKLMYLYASASYTLDFILFIKEFCMKST